MDFGGTARIAANSIIVSSASGPVTRLILDILLKSWAKALREVRNTNLSMIRDWMEEARYVIQGVKAILDRAIECLPISISCAASAHHR